MNGDAHAPIARMRLITGNGIELDDNTIYNLNSCVEQVLSGSAVVQAKKWAAAGDYLAAAQDSEFPVTTSNQRMVIRPNLSMFKALDGIHLNLFDRVTLEVYWELDATVVNNAVGSAETYVVSTPELHVSLTPMTNDHIQKLEVAAARGDVLYSYPRLYHTSKAYVNANDSMNVQYIADSVRAVTAVFRLSADVAAADKNSLCKFQFPTALTSAQWIHGSDYYPEQALTTPAEMFEHSLASLGLQNDISTGSLITRARYNGADSESAPPLFILRQKLNRSNSPLTGVSIKHTPLQLRTVNTAVAGLQCELIVEYDASFTVLPGGQGLMRV
jgi:hypothetical protein